jgi:hypothetical protein
MWSLILGLWGCRLIRLLVIGPVGFIFRFSAMTFEFGYGMLDFEDKYCYFAKRAFI